MSRKYKFGGIGLLVAIIIAALVVYLSHHTIAVLQPAGQVSSKERQLMIFGVLLSVIVVVPTFALTIFIAWKYRESNHRPKKYSPDWDQSRLFESIWWGIPIVIIGILTVVVWQSSHQLDPYRSLVSTKKPLTIQVVALDWKWLFIYPDQHIASVNQAEIPVGTPVDFQITSDTVMNSFWVPQLGGQIYAMPGMITELHLNADKPGTYSGSSANISGSGFAGMTFHVVAGSSTGFNHWVTQARWTPRALDVNSYKQLAKPSKNVPVKYYAAVQNGLFTYTALKYMTPTASLAQISKPGKPGRSTPGNSSTSNNNVFKTLITPRAAPMPVTGAKP